jgi:hypothetical protein
MSLILGIIGSHLDITSAPYGHQDRNAFIGRKTRMRKATWW